MSMLDPKPTTEALRNMELEYDMASNDNQELYRNRVREIRLSELMTQEQLAHRARLALRTIHSVEKGQKCRMTTKRKLLLALGRSFEERTQVFPEC